MEGNLVGLVARFQDHEVLLKAVHEMRRSGYKKFDVHTPYPIHGMDEAMGLRPSILGWLAAIGALGAGTTAILLQWWTSAVDYKIVVSGKPLFSYQAFVPITFELTILGAALFIVFGMFVLNKLPMLYHELFHSRLLQTSGVDGMIISISSRDRIFSIDKTTSDLKNFGALEIETVRAEE